MTSIDSSLCCLLAASLALTAAPVTAQCGDQRLSSQVDIACEHSNVNIRCPAGSRIQITSAFYGRTSKDVCTSGPMQTLECNSDRAPSVVSGLCDNQQQCTVPISNSAFSDPCFGTFKYGVVAHRCIDSTRSPIIQQVIACENSLLNIQCPPGKVICIHSGFYGRNSDQVCSSGPQRTLECTNDSATSVISSRCNGQSMCSVEVSNTGFGGDPCEGTYKYATATYQCINADRDAATTD